MVDGLPRIYEAMLRDHLRRHRQMAFVSGPRQVGKTTSCRGVASARGYLNWDNDDDRRIIERGPEALADRLDLSRLRRAPPVVVFDELHKYRRWKTLIKGIFDTFEDRARIIVTGSSRLDVYRRGGDSLMGRYFSFRMHPFSVGEIARQRLPEQPTRPPRAIPEADFAALWRFGGYPEPFAQREARFHVRWKTLRQQQLVREDIRDATRIQELGQIESLLTLLRERSGGQLIYTGLAEQIRVAVETIRRWIDTLESFHAGFRVRPWATNVAKALRKEPKWYATDWSEIEDPGARAETFVACHLLKAVHGWNDLGLGTFELRYLRDKDKREVDFLIVRDRKPWFLVEVKSSDTKLSPNLAHFQQQVSAAHAFQVVLDLDYVDRDCFTERRPIVVPARTFLSQLL
ncbi:MAG: ATP-binding protein [Myxococcales bacterium]|jgi:predicted AAA+ superfamily ATPase|nr:ATP-binding protein [Myxococcales bacterium]